MVRHGLRWSDAGFLAGGLVSVIDDALLQIDAERAVELLTYLASTRGRLLRFAVSR